MFSDPDGTTLDTYGVSVGLADLGLGLPALEALPENRDAAIAVLAQICARHGVRMATGRLATRPAPGG